MVRAPRFSPKSRDWVGKDPSSLGPCLFHPFPNFLQQKDFLEDGTTLLALTTKGAVSHGVTLAQEVDGLVYIAEL